MALFHAAFVALKARCPLTITGHPEDYKLTGEKLLFQGYYVQFWSEVFVASHRKIHFANNVGLDKLLTMVLSIY
jgi:hypothetical protein